MLLRVAGDRPWPNTKGKDMNKLIGMTKVALVGLTLASATTGCCLFGDKPCCQSTCQEECCGGKACCDKKPCCDKPGAEKKTHGINTSMTLGIGTDGISAGSESNIGSHGASASMSTH